MPQIEAKYIPDNPELELRANQLIPDLDKTGTWPDHFRLIGIWEIDLSKTNLEGISASKGHVYEFNFCPPIDQNHLDVMMVYDSWLATYLHVETEGSDLLLRINAQKWFRSQDLELFGAEKDQE